MPAGEHFSSAERLAIDEAIRKAEQLCRYEFSVFVGSTDGDARTFATQLHNSLVAPARSIVIMVDPEQRALEIVTGGYVRRTLTDEEVQLAAMQMQSSFAEGALVEGLTTGIQMLAEHGRA